MLYYYRLSGYLSQVYNNNNRQSWEAQGKEAQQGWSILHGCRRFVVVVVVGGGELSWGGCPWLIAIELVC